MDQNHLNVPGTSHSQTSQINEFVGRPRSGSTRSQRSAATPTPERPIDYDRRPSIRIRGFSGVQQTLASDSGSTAIDGQHVGSATRNRSTSAPQRPQTQQPPRLAANGTYMPEVSEEITSPTSGAVTHASGPANAPVAETPTPLTRLSSWRPLKRARTNIAQSDFDGNSGNDYENDLVDFLDTIDPEVATLNTLNNVQNSLFVPDLGRYLNRRPTYTLTRPQADIEDQDSSSGDDAESRKEERRPVQRQESLATLNTLNSRVNDRYYAVLPHGVSVAGWTEEEKLEMNDYVRHMMHSRRSKFKRSMRGFGQYVRKPLGAFVTIYATLITLFGLAWVLFLIGWINVGGRQLYIINIIDNILVALFAIMGDGLAPFRAVDTYHMIFIAHYHHLTWRLRKEKALPKLQDRNDLPSLSTGEEATDSEKQISVLSEEQQKKLAHHQKKFAKSHSFYKPHETGTHHAFPLRLLVAVVVLLDCHSMLQISLGACTWGIYYKDRPFALTTVILCCSISCNITAGILIMVGDRKTRKKDVLERMNRQELTRSAIKKVEKRRERESMDILRETGMSIDMMRDGEGQGKEKKTMQDQATDAGVAGSAGVAGVGVAGSGAVAATG